MSARKKPAPTPAAPRPLPAYSPEVESHRAAYAAVAEALIRLDRAKGAQAVQVLDVEPSGWVEPEPEPNILWRGVQAHMAALFETVSVMYTDEFMRTLYVELRLFVDERQRHFKCGMYAYRQRRGGAR